MLKKSRGRLTTFHRFTMAFKKKNLVQTYGERFKPRLNYCEFCM